MFKLIYTELQNYTINIQNVQIIKVYVCVCVCVENTKSMINSQHHWNLWTLTKYHQAELQMTH